MCQKPLPIHNEWNEVQHVQCRNCNECISARKRHWIGRLLAEQQTCVETWFCTFTYGGGYENEEAYWLDYSHMQKMFKRLRKAGYKFKYVVVGEHGAEKSRAHFHALFYWQTTPPPVEKFHTREDPAMIQWPFWTKGHSTIEYPRSQQGSASYIMDYMNKDNLKRAVMKYSKNPMLGKEYLEDYAKKHARQGLALFQKGSTFTIPDNLRKNGENFYYPVGEDTAMYETMIMAWLQEWARVRPNEKLPLSESVKEFLADTAQDVNHLPVNVQWYLDEHYDVQPNLYLKRKEVYTVTENLTLTFDWPTVHIEVWDNEGNKTWVKPVRIKEDPIKLTESGLVECLLALENAINNGNKRLRHFVPIAHLIENALSKERSQLSRQLAAE